MKFNHFLLTNFPIFSLLFISSSADTYLNIRKDFMSLFLSSSRRERFSPEPSGKLILTPLISSGNVNEAKEAARVTLPFENVLSYSGFFTVNKTYNSNLFFWFFPAKNDPRNAPLMLWLQGGPGFSVMFGLFVEHGPFYIDSDGSPKIRDHSWTNSHSMIYVDSPVGSGFSFTDSNVGYAKNQEDVTRDLYEFMNQFMTLFPEYRRNDFYLGGESYAGKFIPPLAMKIHNENQISQNKLNLKGISLGAPFSDPMSVIEGISEYYYFMGLLDEQQKQDFDLQIVNLKSLLAKNEFSQAFMLLDTLFEGNLISYPSFFKNASGFQYIFNVLNPVMPSHHNSYVNFLNQEPVQQSIHVGRTKFQKESKLVPMFLIGDMFSSVKPIIGQILDLNYKVLVSVGQFDMFIPHTTLYTQIKSIPWKGKDGFLDKKNNRRVWNVDGELAGYIRKFDNLAFVLVRNAGHDAPIDQPKWCLNMINQFVHGNL